MIHDYLTDLAATGHAASTVRLRRYQLCDFARRADLVAADRADVVGWLSGDMAASTRASKRAALTGFYDWAVATGRRTTPSPLAGLPPVHVPASAKRDIPDEVLARVLGVLPRQVQEAAILGRFAGLRAAEIAAVRSGDCASGRLFVKGKGGRERLVPVGGLVADVLGEHDGWVFPGRFGGHVKAGTVTDWLRHGLPRPWTAHSLRHAFATDFYAASGFDLVWTSEVLGHSSVATTQRYVHTVRPADAVVRKIGAHVARSAA